MRDLADHARHVRAMWEDVASAKLVDEVRRAEEALRAALRAKNPEAAERAAAQLETALGQLQPQRPLPWVREVVEIVAVAGAVAMALRCYFVQPFRIPTGSMQPTLYGVQVQEQTGRKWYDWPPLSWASWALLGEGYVEVRARTFGYVGAIYPTPDGEYSVLEVVAQPPNGTGPMPLGSGVPHKFRLRLPLRVVPGQFVAKGEVLASGRVKIGDHVFVDKIRYNFLRPSRGDIIVFDTEKVDFPDLRGDFYIKRLAGLPGERISIRPPHLVVNGAPIESPYPFYRLVHDPRYHGYQLPAGGSPRPPRLSTSEDVLVLGPDEYLPLGDNTLSSLDGRYFGPVHRSALVGPAFMVYWPLSKRWGWVR